MKVIIFLAGLSLLLSTKAVSSVSNKIIDYKADGKDGFVWNLSTKLKCVNKNNKCNNQNAYIRLIDYEFKYKEQHTFQPTNPEYFWWDIFDQYRHEYWKLKESEPDRTLEHFPSLVFRISNAAMYIKNPDKKRLKTASQLVLRTCSWGDSPYEELCDYQPFEYALFSEYIQKSKPIPVVTPFGYSLYLNTNGINDVIEASKTKVEAKIQIEKEAYEVKFKTALIRGVASNIAFLALILCGILILYRVFQKFWPIIKIQVSYYFLIIRGKISKSSKSKYKIGVAQELEALKRLEQLGEISKEDYERAKRKLIAML